MSETDDLIPFETGWLASTIAEQAPEWADLPLRPVVSSGTDNAMVLLGDSLALDGGDWRRAKGWALYGAVIALSYYRGGKNEALCRQSHQTLSRLGLLL